MHLQFIDWLIVAATLLVCFAPALFFGRRAGKSTSEFFASGRSVPWWLAGFSMVATTFSSDTPNLVADIVRRQGVAGVVCGHSHHPAIRDLPGLRYVNTGDWVESCTAICETHDGQFELIKWSAQLQPAPKPPKAPKEGGVLRLRRVGHRAHREREHGERVAQGARQPRCRRP